MGAALDILLHIFMFALFLIYVFAAVIGSMALGTLAGRKTYHAANRLTQKSSIKFIVGLLIAIPIFVLTVSALRFLTEKIGLFGLFEKFGFV